MKKNVLLIGHWKLRVFCIFLISLFYLSNTWAQDREISGQVVDASDSTPLPGVNVLIKGSIAGTITDFDGKFKLTVPETATALEFSFVGYLKQTVEIGTQSVINVNLQVDVEQLEEVVVVGYGVQKKSVVTGAIASVKSEEITETPVLRVEQALQGRTAGVRVDAASGQPGEGMSVIVRGAGTVGDSQPLYVVDGMVVGGIDYLNPGDIESIEVLKDAASAAIYGARAANGVVLITTKQGKEGTFNVSYDGYYGIQNPWKKMSVLNAREYATIQNEAAANGGSSLPFTDPNSFGGGTDWQDEIFERNAPIQNHQVSINGGSEKMTFATSGAYFSQEGIIGGDKSRFKRYSFRFNSKTKISDFFSFGNQATYAKTSRNALDGNSEWGSPLGNAINLDPITPVFETDEDILAGYNPDAVRDGRGNVYGISNYVAQEIVNPLAKNEITFGEYNLDKIVGNFYADFTFLEGLTFRTQFGVDWAYGVDEFYRPIYYLNAAQISDKTLVNKKFEQWFTWQWDNILTFDRSFGDNKHNLGVVLATQSVETNYQDLFGAKTNLLIEDPDNAYINLASDEESQQTNGGAWHYALQSYLGRVNYNFREKYLFSVTVRADGSSNFGENNRYGIFPSASAGWILTNEDFLDDSNVLNFMKLRLSWGRNGNDKIGLYQFVSRIETPSGYSFFDGGVANFQQGAAPQVVANPDLKWETSEQTDVGLDMGFLDDRLLLTLDYYNKTTKDWLITAPIPGYVGLNAPAINGGDVINRGVEVTFNWNKYVGDFTYEFGFNFSYNKNEVQNIPNAEGSILGAGFATYGVVSRAAEGFPIAYFWGYETDGIFQNQEEVDAQTLQPDAVPGDVIFVDTDGNGVLDDEDRTLIGDPNPDFTYGLRFACKFKGFDLSLFCTGVAGNQIFNGTRRNDLVTTNMHTKLLDRWTGAGTSNEWPRVTTNDANGNWVRISDLYIEDGNFFRVKNLQIGYSFPAKWNKALHTKNVRLYISGQNLLTFTGYTGFDPEVGSQDALNVGIDRGIYPQARMFLFGGNITF